MTIPDVKEKWSARVSTLTIGATREDGGTRGRTVTIGGEPGIPFLSFDGETPHPPAIAMEVFDKKPIVWPKPLEDIVIYPTTAALGYGMEYIYSILERGRLAALSGDRLLAQPVILDVGYEAWRAKEAKAGDDFADMWGPAARRGPTWEAVTATNLLQAGADLLVMCHPEAVEAVRSVIGQLVG
jgi:CO dehydrogenase/acetyl-CoA synthase delta subunit